MGLRRWLRQFYVKVRKGLGLVKDYDGLYDDLDCWAYFADGSSWHWEGRPWVCAVWPNRFLPPLKLRHTISSWKCKTRASPFIVPDQAEYLVLDNRCWLHDNDRDPIGRDTEHTSRTMQIASLWTKPGVFILGRVELLAAARGPWQLGRQRRHEDRLKGGHSIWRTLKWSENLYTRCPSSMSRGIVFIRG